MLFGKMSLAIREDFHNREFLALFFFEMATGYHEPRFRPIACVDF
jgi:hypothetical protein